MNFARVEFASQSANEGFARNTVAAFLLQYDPTIEVMADVKTAVSEAVTNSIVHGYREKSGPVVMELKSENGVFSVTVEDYGCGIPDIEKAREPLFTTHGEEERSGMGFTVMEMFMDTVDVISNVGVGTKVIMTKRL